MTTAPRRSLKRPHPVTRRGFTLIEVITAITLTAIVLGIAAAALGAATSARSSVEAHRRSLESESRLQSLLTDMLRHAPPPDAVDEAMLRIDRDGANRQTLVFLSTGVREPYGTGDIWRVTLSHDGARLSLDAEPVRGSERAMQLHSQLDDVRNFDVRALEPERAGETAVWRTDWPVLRTRPALVSLTVDRSSTPSGARSSAQAGANAPTPWIIALDPLEAHR